MTTTPLHRAATWTDALAFAALEQQRTGRYKKIVLVDLSKRSLLAKRATLLSMVRFSNENHGVPAAVPEVVETTVYLGCMLKHRDADLVIFDAGAIGEDFIYQVVPVLRQCNHFIVVLPDPKQVTIVDNINYSLLPAVPAAPPM